MTTATRVAGPSRVVEPRRETVALATEPSRLPLSVVVATYRRPDRVAALLRAFGVQTLPADRFEVIVVDDGSDPPIETVLADVPRPYASCILWQPNAGPAAARDAGIRRARGDVIVVVDDDMAIGSGFLAAHLAAHADGRPRVVLGHMRAVGDHALAFLDRWRMLAFDQRVARARASCRPLHGEDVYTGNVSFPRATYLAAGGFDATLRLSEDAELGLRLERAGAEVALSDEAWSYHMDTGLTLRSWERRAVAYGAAQARIAAKHPDVLAASPWYPFPDVSRVLRPWLMLAVVAPRVATVFARGAILAALALDALRLESPALAAATVSYGMRYMTGVRGVLGSARSALADRRRHVARRAGKEGAP